MEVKVVPWYNAAEFRRVYDCVFSPQMADKNWAVETMSVWKTRCDPCLPAAIECTYLITTTLIQDALFMAKNSVTRQQAIELQYSCAIVRFVNLTVSVHEKKFEKPTVTQVAKLLGIPTFIVDLRNQISHTTLTPPLPHLRLAAEAALDYLKKSYWDIEAPRVKNHIMKRPDKTEYRDAICRYAKTKLEVVRGAEKVVPNYDEESDAEDANDGDSDVIESVRQVFKSGQGKKRSMRCKNAAEDGDEMEVTDEVSNEKEAEEMAKIEKAARIEEAKERKKLLLVELKNCLRAIDKLLDRNKHIFVDVFVTEFFIPSDKNMKFFVNRETYELFTDVLDEHEDKSPNSTPKESCIPEIPESHEVLWLPILRQLNRNDAVTLFLEKLLLSQTYQTVIGQKLVLAWVIKILKVFCKEGRDSLTEKDHRIINIFKRKGIVATWERLFMSALENPCKYTPLVLPWITRQFTIDKTIEDRCMTLLAIYLCQTVDVKTTPQPERIFTLQYLKKRAKLFQEAARLECVNKEVEECLFKKNTDDRFANLPIGYRIPADNKQNVEEEDNFKTEDKDFKVEYIIGDSEWEDIDLDEYYSMFELSDSSDDEPLSEEYLEELDERESVLYNMQ